MTNIIEIEKVTKEMKKAMKGATTVCFRLLENGQSRIELIKNMKIDGFDTESRKNILVDTRKLNFERFGNEDDYYGNYEIYKGFVHLMHSHDVLEWQTVVKNLKIEDEIILEWIAGNNHNTLDKCGLSNDELAIIIRRNETNILKFKIDSLVCEKHSSARMVSVRKKLYRG
jgi:hypothetical protein